MKIFPRTFPLSDPSPLVRWPNRSLPTPGLGSSPVSAVPAEALAAPLGSVSCLVSLSLLSGVIFVLSSLTQT